MSSSSPRHPAQPPGSTAPDLDPGTRAALGRVIALAWLARTILRLERTRTAAVALLGGLGSTTALALLPSPGTVLVPALAVVAAWFGGALALRHTRGAEDDGTAELIRVGVVSPSAPPFATALALDLTQAVLAVAVALGAWAGGALRATGPAAPVAGEWTGWSGALLLGVVTAGVGTTAGCLALLIGSLCAPGRRARVAAVGLGLVAVVVWAGWGVRADGVGPAWLSPLTWAVAARPLGDMTAWPLVLMAVVGDASVGAAIALWHRSGPRLRLAEDEREFVRGCLEQSGVLPRRGIDDDLLDDPVRLHEHVVHIGAGARLWPTLTVAQNLEGLDGLRGLTSAPSRRRAALEEVWGGGQAVDRLLGRRAGTLTRQESARLLAAWAHSQDVAAVLLPAPSA